MAVSQEEERTERLTDDDIGRSPFDRFGQAASDFTSRGIFFAGCIGVGFSSLSSRTRSAGAKRWSRRS
jgi:hypothetical protein